MEETTITMRTVDPDFVVTQEIAVVPTLKMPVIPERLVRDPIMTMSAVAEIRAPLSLFDHYFGDRPRFYPARPVRAPHVSWKYRTRGISRQDKVLIGMTFAVVAMGATTYGLVESGWRADIPQEPRPPQQSFRQDLLPHVLPWTPSPSSLPSRSPHGARRVPASTGPAYVPPLPLVRPSRPQAPATVAVSSLPVRPPVTSPPTAATVPAPSPSPDPSPSSSTSPSASPSASLPVPPSSGVPVPSGSTSPTSSPL